MDVQIRELEERYFDAWHKMRKALYTGLDDEFDRKEMALILHADDKACFLAFEGEKVVGFVELALRNVVDGCLTNSVGYLEGIFVEPWVRRAGLGRQLVEFAAEWCKAMGCTEMATDSELANVDAQAFHERMGFKETFRTVGYRKDL